MLNKIEKQGRPSLLGPGLSVGHPLIGRCGERWSTAGQRGGSAGRVLDPRVASGPQPAGQPQAVFLRRSIRGKAQPCPFGV